MTPFKPETNLPSELDDDLRFEAMKWMAENFSVRLADLLTAVWGNVSLARLKSDEPEVIEFLREAERSCESLKTMCATLLDFGRGAEPVVERLDAGEVLAGALDTVRREFNVPIAYLPPEYPCPIMADGSLIPRALLELLDNAVKSMEAGSPVEVRLERARDQLSGDGRDEVVVSVIDRGEGIEPEHCLRIFDPFFTARRAARGFGLAFVRDIVRGHGGRVTVESSPGGGSVFRICLPAAD